MPNRKGSAIKNRLSDIDQEGGALGLRDLALAGVFYLGATVLLTYPLALHPASLSRLDNHDAQLNAWTVSWVAHQVLSDPLQLFQANTFYPLPNSLAFSEHLILPGLITLPILIVSNDLVLTFNLLLFISVVVSALGMYVLVAWLTGSRSAALLSGLFFSFASYRFVRLPHLQMQLYGFMPLAVFALHRFLTSGRGRWAFAFSAFFLLQALSGTYLAAMTAVATVWALVVLGATASWTWRRWTFLLLAMGVIVLALCPLLRPYLWVNHHLGIEWDLEGIGSMSATPASYLASGSRLYRGLVGTVLPSREVRDFLFPGVTEILLGGLGAGLLMAGRGGLRRPRTTAVFYLGILAIGMLLSFGPATPLYPLLHENIVFFRGLRALTRFGLLPLFSLSVLSGIALAWWLNRTKRAMRYAAVWGVGILFMAESLVAPLSLTRFRDQPPEVYRWLRNEGKPGAIVELPYKRIDTRYMFWARHHGFRDSLNGDSGFIPPSHEWMRQIFLRFPSPDAMALLQDLGVRYVVVYQGAYRRSPRRLTRLIEGLESQPGSLTLAKKFGRDLVLEVTPSEAAPTSATSGRRLDVVAPPELVDSNLNTHWTGESPDAMVEVRLEQRQLVSGVRFHYGRAPQVPVIRVEVESKVGDGNWCPVFLSWPERPALAELVMGLLENPRDGTQTFSFPTPLRSDALRLRLRGYGKPPQIAELEILGHP